MLSMGIFWDRVTVRQERKKSDTVHYPWLLSLKKKGHRRFTAFNSKSSEAITLLYLRKRQYIKFKFKEILLSAVIVILLLASSNSIPHSVIETAW